MYNALHWKLCKETVLHGDELAGAEATRQDLNKQILQVALPAQSRVVIYSLIETVKESDLEPYRYLVWLLHNVPVLSQTDETWAVLSSL